MEEHEGLSRESIISTVETGNPACKLYKNAEEESENPARSSYSTAGWSKDTSPEHKYEELTRRQLYTTFEEPSTKANDSSRNCMNAEDVDAENETSENNAVAEYSYLSEDHQQCINTQQGGSLLITGRLKVMDLWKN